jgi:hypothetical protein
VDIKLGALLKAFKSEDLHQKTIDYEVEIVRAKFYAGSMGS